MIKAKVFKIKEGRTHQWEQWCIEIEKNRDEAIKTLQQENVSRETYFYFSNSGVQYMVMVIQSPGEIRKSDQESRMNIKHRIMKEECLEYFGIVETWLDLEA